MENFTKDEKLELFAHAPCKNQYCVQQGWVHLTGQMLICISNEVSIEILGKTKAYDSLNY